MSKIDLLEERLKEFEEQKKEIEIKIRKVKIEMRWLKIKRKAQDKKKVGNNIHNNIKRYKKLLRWE